MQRQREVFVITTNATAAHLINFLSNKSARMAAILGGGRGRPSRLNTLMPVVPATSQNPKPVIILGVMPEGSTRMKYLEQNVKHSVSGGGNKETLQLIWAGRGGAYFSLCCTCSGGSLMSMMMGVLRARRE